jgi:hypothetical protein
MVMGINNSISYLKKASIPALFKELRKREGVSCIVVDDKYVLQIDKSEVDIYDYANEKHKKKIK